MGEDSVDLDDGAGIARHSGGQVQTVLNESFFVEFLGSSKTNLIRDSFASQIGCDLYGIRPEHLELLIEKGLWKGRSRHAEHLGSNTLAYVEAEGLAPLKVYLIGQRIFKTSQEVCLTP